MIDGFKLGVAPDSVLGSVFFTIYVNYVGVRINNLNRKFADHMKIGNSQWRRQAKPTIGFDRSFDYKMRFVKLKNVQCVNYLVE